MHGGVILFRGTGAAACRYLESDRSRADDYYLEDGATLAAFTVTDGTGEVLATAELGAEAYAGWVDWVDPLTGSSMGKPRLPGEEGTSKHGSPRFAEMVVNTPKSLSIAAALHPQVSSALDAAQADAVNEIRRFLAQHSVTRVGPRGRQEVVPVERLQTVAVVHKTSRAGDPHRHVHFQIDTRVWAAGKWRGLDTAALFEQQGAIRALGTAVLAAHPRLAGALDQVGLTLDPVTGEVTELEPFNALMSKRAAQVEKNLAAAEADWEEAHPGQQPGRSIHARMVAAAWAKGRPQKRPSALAHEEAWRQELTVAGYDPTRFAQRSFPDHRPAGLDDLEIPTVASRALDRCAAAASTWTRHTVQEHVTHLITEAGVRAAPDDLHQLFVLATDLAVSDCLSVLPAGTAQPEHVAHLTSLQVIAAETKLRDLLTTAIEAGGTGSHRAPAPTNNGLDDAPAQAAAAIASTDPLVIVEGAAGAGKTTMLGAAITTAGGEGRRTRIVTPTKKAADVAGRKLDVPAESVARLLHAYGWRWNDDGVWTRVHGDIPAWARLDHGERIVIDEAGMLDQDSAIALLTLAAESGATIALVGDRAQLPAVGRGGVLDMAAAIAVGDGQTVHDLDTVHRFSDPEYADLTVRIRAGHNPSDLFDQLRNLGLVQVHDSEATAHDAVAEAASARSSTAVVVATNDEARMLNERIHDARVANGDVDDATTATGSDGLPIGVGDVITTRRNDTDLGVANRQTWTVQQVGADGSLSVLEATSARKHHTTVTLPESYVVEHVHLGYAATAYGVQGITTTDAHTLLTEALEAAGVYVGITRGRVKNVVHIAAENMDDARDQFVEAMQRDRADRGLDVATVGAKEAVTGLAAEGPVKKVNGERARVATLIEQADLEAARWERGAALLAAQSRAYANEEAAARGVLHAAKERLWTVRSEALAPLLAQALGEGQTYLTSDAAEHEAWKAAQSAGRLRKRAAEQRHTLASEDARTQREALLDRWGSAPQPDRWGHQTRDSLQPWAERVANAAVDTTPIVQTARAGVDHASDVLSQTTNRHRREARELTIAVYGRHDAASVRKTSGPNSAQARAERWQQRGEDLRQHLALGRVSLLAKPDGDGA